MCTYNTFLGSLKCFAIDVGTFLIIIGMIIGMCVIMEFKGKK